MNPIPKSAHWGVTCSTVCQITSLLISLIIGLESLAQEDSIIFGHIEYKKVKFDSNNIVVYQEIIRPKVVTPKQKGQAKSPTKLSADSIISFGSIFDFFDKSSKPKTLRLKYYERGNHMFTRDTNASIEIDSCYFEDSSIISIGQANHFKIRNCYFGYSCLIRPKDSVSTYDSALLSQLNGGALLIRHIAAGSIRLSNLNSTHTSLYDLKSSGVVRISASGRGYLVPPGKRLINPRIAADKFDVDSLVIGSDAIHASFKGCVSNHISIVGELIASYPPGNTEVTGSTVKTLAVGRSYRNLTFSDVIVEDTVKIIRGFFIPALTFISVRKPYPGKIWQMDGIEMRPGSVIYTPLDVSPLDLKPTLNSLQSASLVFRYDSTKRDFYGRVQDELFLLVNKLEDSNIVNKESKAGVIEWIKYQQERYKERALGEKKNKTFGEYLSLIWRKILRFTANYGYQGEWPFIRTLLIFMLLWSLIYYFAFRNQIAHFVLYNEAYRFNSANSNRWSFFKNVYEYFMCVWFSFIVFANPRFPKSYFTFSHNLFFWLILEWIIGFILLVIFLVYIASKYSIVQKVFGV